MAFVQLWGSGVGGGNLETSVISAAIKHVTLQLRHINNSDRESILKTMGKQRSEKLRCFDQAKLKETLKDSYKI